jgi:hypothetical protein
MSKVLHYISMRHFSVHCFAVETLVPVIAKADGTCRASEAAGALVGAIQEDAMPYLESIVDYWGD